MNDRANVWQFRVGQRRVDEWERGVWSKRAQEDAGHIPWDPRRRVGVDDTTCGRTEACKGDDTMLDKKETQCVAGDDDDES